jgi:hypothetical protein
MSKAARSVEPLQWGCGSLGAIQHEQDAHEVRSYCTTQKLYSSADTRMDELREQSTLLHSRPQYDGCSGGRHAQTHLAARYSLAQRAQHPPKTPPTPM